MLNKNNVLTGVLIALVFPVISFLVSSLLKTNFYVMNKPGLPYLIAIGLNLVLIRIFTRRDADLTAKGIMLTTFVFLIVVFMFVIRHVR
jgi:hypothetical protein